MGKKFDKKTIFYWATILVLSGLFIGFLVAWIKERNSNSNEIITTTTTISPTIPTPKPIDTTKLRLNKFVIPTNYKLNIKSDHLNNKFSGTISIDLNVKDTVDKIILHCKDLKIDKSSLNKNVVISDVQVDADYELCIFNLKASITPGEYELTIDFSGIFKEGQITGFYKTSYLTTDNQIRYLTATKFEPTYARMAFPCFDEPEFKAPFELTIVHPNDLTALSNEIDTSVVSLDDGWKKTTFAKTAPMSTYLVAFIICDFKFTETKTTFGTRVRVYSRPDQVTKTYFALDAAANALRYFENYTSIDYALSKMDLIGLPEFVSGAMENWGLVTYKETNILFSMTDSSEAERRSIAGTISHELAHNWFGNLVTLNWWNELWLNEGFASFFEYKGQNSINPKWNIFDRFLINDLHSAIRADLLKSAHPLKNVNVITPDQITAQFNTITYSKGASILFMLENIIGKDRFQVATKNYLKDNQFKTATTDSMLGYYNEAIKTATNVDGKLFMKKWIESNGIPMITVKRTETHVELTQSRFGRKEESINDNEPWYIQVVYSLGNSQTGSWVLTKMTDKFPLTNPVSLSKSIKLNKGGDYYYIVNYSDEDWKLLADELKHKTLNNRDRANLLFDAFQLADKSHLSYKTLFNLFDYLPVEDDYLPWSVANLAINSLLNKLSTSNGAALMNYKVYISKLVSNVFDSTIDLETSALTADQLTHRSNLIALACKVEHERCLSLCYNLFRNWLDQGVKVDPNIRSYVYSYGLQTSKLESDWLRVWDMYLAEKDALEKSKLMSALTNSKSSSLISLLIDFSTNQSLVNNENFFAVQTNIAANSDIGRSMVWDYIRNSWKELVERFGLNDRRLGNYVKSVTSGFGTESRLAEIETFFAKYPNAGAGENARKEALETVKQNIAWVKSNEQQITESLEEKDETTRPWLNWRLDELIRPSHYDLNLTIDVDNEVFTGLVNININVAKPIRYLILHSKNLIITESNVYAKSSNNRVSLVDGAFEYPLNQYWIIPMKLIIGAGEYVAQLRFSGRLSQSLSGLYVSRYMKDNKVVKLATTQFEASYARKAFPCFDEPQFKATFKISINHHNKYSAISNMPVEYVQQYNKTYLSTVFLPSVRMSTYPLAFVVSDFVSKKNADSSVTFSIYTYNPDVNLKKVDYALKIGPGVLNYFSNYFGIPYPLPKLDMISIPDFSMGAMENWGLVTYRDVYILYDPKESSSASKMTVCYIIAHELAHMWFGNLVTIKWWDDIWLNEGFAQFMQYKATSHVEPEWNYFEHFAINELSRVFETDSSVSTHAILSLVQNENDIQSAFDPVTYAKGASIIRMLENTMGEKDFQRGISSYLHKHSYKNTLTGDLWQELADASTNRLNISDLMTGWIKKEGFPVITVTIDSNKKYRLSQERFLKDFDYTNSTYFWNIPVTYRSIDIKNVEIEPKTQQFYMNSLTMGTDILASDDQLIKFNIDQMGVYILNYPLNVWKQWSKLLQDSTSIAWSHLSALDRHNLLSDAFYLSRSGRLSYEVTLELAKFLKHEKSFIVWRTASSMFSYLRTFVIREDRAVAFNQWLNTEILDKHYDELGWESTETDGENKKRLRVLIVNEACNANNAKCLQKANEKFTEYMQSKRDIDYVHNPDMFNVFLIHAMRTVTDNEGGEKFTFLEKKYEASQTTDEKLNLLSGMTSIQSEAKLQLLIDKSLEDSYLRKQDFFTFLSYMASNRIGLNLAWNFYTTNYMKIVDHFGLDDSNLGRAIYRFAAYFNTEAQLKEVKEFYEKYPDGGAGQLYRQQAIELIEANIAWSKKHYNTVIETFTKSCNEKICPWMIYRLNSNIKPLLYDLTIQINTETNLYSGTVLTTLEVTANEDNSIDHIIMHAADILNVESPEVQMIDTQEKTKLTIDYSFRYSPLEFYVIKLKQPIKTNVKLTIKLSFDGNLLLGGLVGLYRSYYESNNKTVNLAATQFEATHARKMFPCFDEPTFKQEIDITIIHPKSKMLTLTNMPVSSKEDHPEMLDWSITKYKRSVKMVTYLIAILVSDFECSEATINANNIRSYPVTSRVCASKLNDAKKHKYALDVTEKVIEVFETSLGHPYQITKVDQVAIPQFSAGAMENWGLVKYRESLLLWTEEENTAASQRSVVSTISHELAHMWFGNQVTCYFWGHLWLNEAFASFMEFIAVSKVETDWNYFDLFAYYDTMRAMQTDSQESALSIVRPVNSPALMPYNSSIVYQKGSSILNMLYHLMTEEKFFNALNKYLKDHAYDTAKTKDLINILGEEQYWLYNDQITLEEFMNTWLHKPGFPYLTIDYNKDDQTYTYTQERYLENGQKAKEDIVYPIPFSYYKFDSSSSKVLKESSVVFLEEKAGKLPDDFKNFNKVNPNFNGFYLVNYPADYWDELSQRLMKNDNDYVNKLTVNDRVELIWSAYLLTKANLVDYLTTFKLYNYLVYENHFVPWYFYAYTFPKLAVEISFSEYRESVLQFERRLVKPHYKESLWKNEGTNIQRQFNADMIKYACRSQTVDCLQHAYNHFSNWKASKGKAELLTPNLEENILSFGIYQSKSDDDYQFVWDMYIQAKAGSSRKMTFLYSLAAIQNFDKLHHYIELALNENVVSKSDFVTFFTTIIEWYTNQKALWYYFNDNYSMLSKKLSSSQISTILNRFAIHSTTNEWRMILNRFLQEHSGISANTVDSIRKTIDVNWEFKDKHLKEVGEWLSMNACGDLIPKPCPWSSLRIDKEAMKPTQYDLTIQVNLTTSIYNGTVEIAVEAKKEFEVILLHAADMLQVELESIKLNEANIFARLTTYRPNDYLIIRFDSKQSAGTYAIKLKFNASLRNSGLSGLYPSTYNDENGEKNSLALTQFQFHDARKVFPCFDEPTFKAAFKLTIIHDQQMNATLANMESVKQETVIGTAWKRTEYARTPLMSTYLLAMMVSDFVKVEKTKYNINWGVYGSPIQQNKLDFALNWAPECFNYLQTKLDYKQPKEITKIDLLAIPDFKFGAMENWGLITFRESALLYDKSETTSATKMSILSIITHEVAHFWFGNVVTCDWWDYLWLNEALATFMQYPTLKNVQPDWNYDEMFMINALEPAFMADASTSAHPLTRNIKKTSAIAAINSDIIYSKGASLIRMIEFVFGDENKFYSALSAYLKDNELKNTKPENLFKQFDDHFSTPDSAIETISILMDEWTNTNGFPYVSVSKQANGSYLFKQNRFLFTGEANEETIWKIPISYYTKDDWTAHNIRFMTEESLTINGLGDNELIKFNVKHNGFYLTNYSPDLWKQWLKVLVDEKNNIKLPLLDRAGLLMDSFLLARGNQLSYYFPLYLSKYLENEEHVTPWTVAINGLNHIRRYMLFNKQYEQFVLGIMSKLYDKQDWTAKDGKNEGKNDFDNRLKAIIVYWACSYNHAGCLAKSAQMFTKWKENKENNQQEEMPNPNLLATILEFGLKDTFDWYFIYSQYLKETSVSLKQIYLRALANSNDQNLVKMLLTQALEANGINSQNSYSVMMSVATSFKQTNLETIWNFVKENYVRLAEDISPLQPAQLVTLINTICNNYFFTSTQSLELKSLLERYPTIGLTAAQRIHALNLVKNNIRWIDTKAKEVENFLLCKAEECPLNKFRLDSDIIPERYDLEFTIDLEKDQFQGSAVITVDLSNAKEREIKYLVLHAASSLKILTAEIQNEEEMSLKIIQNLTYPTYDYFVLETKPIDKTFNKVKLLFTFESSLSTDMFGLYKSEYFDSENRKTVKLASTQFQDIYARRAFPCFDEPAFKSVFQVTLNHKSQYNVLSNTPILEVKEDGDRRITKFKPTPKMVTYLLAFVISDFYCDYNNEIDRIKVGVCASPPEKNKIAYSLQMAPKIIMEFETKFKVNYKLPKMDLLAIPDFSAGAMENWGLLTFRETALLYDQKQSTASDKMYVLSVVAHEIAHMWFGNLVTCQFWSDLWLNEAFASYLEYFSLSAVEPDWDYDQLFYITDYIAGMNADSSSTAHPLVRSVKKPSEIAYISNIIYQKGASILRMFNSVLGDNQFYELLSTYLKNNEYKNVVSSQLIEALAKAEVEKLNNVKDFLESWTMKAGFPYINVSRTENNKYILKQARYISKGVLNDDSQLWVVPITYYLNYAMDGKSQTYFMTEQQESIDLDENFDGNNDLPIKFNVDAQGFYIINYDLATWNQWAKLFKDEEKIKASHLTSQDYSNLMFDAFNLAKVKLLPYDISLSLTSIMKHSELLSVWSTGSTIFGQMLPYFMTNETSGLNYNMQKRFKIYAQSMVSNLYSFYGLQSPMNENNLLKQRLHSIISSFACVYGLPRCQLEAQVEFKKWSTGQEISPNLIVTILRFAIQNSNDPSDWEYLWTRYTNELTTSVKLNYLQGLAQTTNIDLLNKLFDRANDQSLVRRQNYLSLFSYSVRNPTGFQFSWNYFKTNYKNIQTNRVSQSGLGTMAGYFANYINNEQMKNEFEQFYRTHNDIKISTTSLNNALQVIDQNIAWVNNYRQVVYDWLKKVTKH